MIAKKWWQRKWWDRRPKWKQILEEPGALEDLKRKGRRLNKGEAGKTYMKRCSRCGKIYRTYSKFSKICDGCKIPWGKQGIYTMSNEIDEDGDKEKTENSGR